MMVNQFNAFATGDVNMRQLFHCLQWYTSSALYYYNNNNNNNNTHIIIIVIAGSERVKEIHAETCAIVQYGTMEGRSYITIKFAA